MGSSKPRSTPRIWNANVTGRLLDEEVKLGWMETWLKPHGKDIDRYITLLKDSQGDALGFIDACQQFNDFFTKEYLHVLGKFYVMHRDSIETYAGTEFDEALKWNWNGLMAVYTYLRRQVYIPPDVMNFVERVRQLLRFQYPNEFELAEALDKFQRSFTARSNRTRSKVNNGFGHDRRNLFALPKEMEGVICTSQCFYGSGCGWCRGCRAYSE